MGYRNIFTPCILLAFLLACAEDCEPALAEEPSLQLLQQNLQLGRTPLQAATTPRLPSLIEGDLRKLLDGCSGWECLRRYVQQPDAHYGWKDSSIRLQGKVAGVNWQAALLQMTSQEWLPEEVSPSVWNHSLVVISPEQSKNKGWCLLYVALGFYGSSGASDSVKASDPDVQAAAEIAVAAGIPVVVLFNVPAELLTFKHSEYKGPMVEDIAVLFLRWHSGVIWHRSQN